MKRTFRPHQVKSFLLLRESLRQKHRRPMLMAPTGAGKTLLAAGMVDGARAKGKRVIFVVPAKALVDQTVASFVDEGLTDLGVIQADHPLTDWTKPIQIASVQTLSRRTLPKADLVIIDEAHLWFRFYGEWMSDPEWRDVPFVGLSATPWTRGLGKHFDDLLIPTSIGDLIEAGYLSPFKVFVPSKPDLSDVRTVAGDYHEGDLSQVMDKAALVSCRIDFDGLILAENG